MLEALAGHETAARQTLESFLKPPDLDPDLKQRIQETLRGLPATRGQAKESPTATSKVSDRA